MKPVSRHDAPARVTAPYAVFADVMLRAEAAASAVVGEVDVAMLVGRLPSFDPGTSRDEAAAAVRGEVDSSREALHRELAAGISVFSRIARSARLSTAAAEVLALVSATEAHLDRQRLVASLNADANAHRVTIGLIARILGPEGAAELSPNARLLTTGLVSTPPGPTWARSDIHLATEATFLIAADVSPQTPRHGSLVDTGEVVTTRELVLVPGKDPSRRHRLAAAALGGNVVVVTKAPSERAGWDDLVRFATLTDRAIVLDAGDELSGEGCECIERADHVRWAIASAHELPIDQIPNRPWTELSAANVAATVDELADAFGSDREIPHRLTAHQALLAGRAFDGTDPDGAVRRLASGDIDRLAARVRPSRGWTDLVLPAEQLALVHDVVDRYHHRGEVYERWGFKPVPSAGVVAMFSGPPGTGKTLSAEVVAKEIGLDMYRIDLSSLVSKYIGETEKNLDKVFRAAEGGTMVLLFDEADAVFGKRSDVSDANDRYANVETSYLLQRLESYDGVVILTTNYASNIDSAFMRRIHVSVEFTAPDEEERLRLWAQSFPPTAPLGDLDLPLLAKRFKLSGSAIRSVALGAAFRSAAASQAIGMDDVVESLRSELRKQGRVATSGDLLSEPDIVPTGRGGRRN